jgi:hypothetical protein
MSSPQKSPLNYTISWKDVIVNCFETLE